MSLQPKSPYWESRRYSEGDQVLVKLLVPPHWKDQTVLVRGVVAEVVAEVAYGLPLLVPMCRVRLFLAETYHSAFGDKYLVNVELEGEPDDFERELDLADGLEPGVDETLCHSVVKACWPDNMRPFQNWYSRFAFNGRLPSGEWEAYYLPEVEAAKAAEFV